MRDELTQARDCASFTAQDLRAALGKASAVEALLLYQMISDAEGLAKRIAALIAAIGACE